MKFHPGDAYIYDSSHGHNVIIIRSDRDGWVKVPVEDHDLGLKDADMEWHLIRFNHYQPDRAVFIRRGVDILPDILLGYADNITF